MRAVLSFLLAATTPAGLPCATICLNDSWDAVPNPSSAALPDRGWTSRRVGVALLLPIDPALHRAVAVSASREGAAWLKAPGPGGYILLTGTHSQTLHLAPRPLRKVHAPR